MFVRQVFFKYYLSAPTRRAMKRLRRRTGVHSQKSRHTSGVHVPHFAVWRKAAPGTDMAILFADF